MAENFSINIQETLKKDQPIFRILITFLLVSIMFIFGRGVYIFHFPGSTALICDVHRHLHCLKLIRVLNVLNMGIGALKCHLPSTDKIIK